MNRIDRLFETKKSGIISLYFTAGATRVDDTADVIRALAEGGIDMIEVGVPFSDPMADGIVIQEAATKALKNGMTLRILFEQLEGIRSSVDIPLILMGYLNPIMQFGFEAFCRRCNDVGVDGVIIPDLPYAEYISTYKPIADRYNINVVMLITPETSEDRIRLIDENTKGFIYMVSSASTTGAQQSFDDTKRAYFGKISGMRLRTPQLIGFGISNKATYEAATMAAAGVIIGSKFVMLLDGCDGDAKKALGELYKAINVSQRAGSGEPKRADFGTPKPFPLTHGLKPFPRH